jgi:hypothetical protein
LLQKLKGVPHVLTGSFGVRVSNDAGAPLQGAATFRTGPPINSPPHLPGDLRQGSPSGREPLVQTPAPVGKEAARRWVWLSWRGRSHAR